jgi:hypothetical protein
VKKSKWWGKVALHLGVAVFDVNLALVYPKWRF